MGEVWLAADEELGDRKVAIKRMRPELLGPDWLARFDQEMRLACQMQHPNIMTMFTSGTENGVPFMVMEYLQGHDLTTLPASWGAAEITRAGRETCLALAYAHGIGVVHRDIKPANLFACESGLVKVTDFGIAKALTVSRATMPGTVIGTPAYMAPEQLLGRPATFAIDVWSTGCVMYELLSGRPARDYSPWAELRAAAVRGDRVAALPATAGVPRWLADAVMTMLETDPANRPSATECATLLSGPPAPPTASAKPAPTWVPRAAPAAAPAWIPKPASVHGSTSAPAAPTVSAGYGQGAAFTLAGRLLDGSGDLTRLGYEHAFSPDGRYFAASAHPVQNDRGYDTLIWDTRTGRLAGQIKGKSRHFIHFSSDSRFLDTSPGAEHDTASPERWDLSIRRLVPVQPNPLVTGPRRFVVTEKVVWRRSKRLYERLYIRGAAEPLASLRELRNRDHSRFCCNVAFSADGGMVAAGTWTGHVYVWDTATGQEAVQCLDAAPYRASGDRSANDYSFILGFLPDGRLFAAARRRGRTFQNVIFWRIAGKTQESWSANQEGEMVLISPDGNTMAIFLKGDATLWDIASRARLGVVTHVDYSMYCFFFPDGRTFAAVNRNHDSAGYGDLRLLDAATLRMTGTPLRDPAGPIVDAVASPDGRLIATASMKGHALAGIRLWRATA